MTFIKLQLDDTTIQAKVLESKKVTSKHTGADLRVLQVEFYTHGQAEHVPVRNLLDLGQAFQVWGEDDQVLGKFKGTQKLHSYTQDSSRARHEWELREIEQLSVADLKLADLTVTPYRYEEEFGDRGLRIQARVRLTEEQESRLRALPAYFPVVRIGISDEPREMRFGQLIWSRRDSEDYKIQLILLDRAYDEDRSLGLFEPQLPNMSRILLATNETLRKMLSVLEKKGVLTAPEKHDLTEVAEQAILDRYKEFFRVRDLDEWEE